jgi:hypothetical protein
MLVHLVVAALTAAGSPPESSYEADVRAALYAQTLQRSQLPGPNGASVEPQTIAAIYGYAFARVTGIDLPWGKDVLSAELSVWGALGALAEPEGQLADADLQSAWLQHTTRATRVRLGRQVTLPGAAHYVRFDGASAGARIGPIDVSGYAGLVTLPRFGHARGYYTLGSVADRLADPSFLDAEVAPGQWLAGALASWVGFSQARASVGFHEQRGPAGVAFRNLSADAFVGPTELPASLGGRFVFDLNAVAPAEARAWVDVFALDQFPLSVDYAYAAPALLLPQGSVLAAFGGQSWHELGVEAAWKPTPYFKLSGRAAGQLYTEASPGARLSLKARWLPLIDGSWTLWAEYVRVSSYDNGYHSARTSSRYTFFSGFATSVDVALYVYDFEVRGKKTSFTAVTNFEVPMGRHFTGLISAQLASTPWARFDAQAFARVVYQLDGPSAGGAF